MKVTVIIVLSLIARMVVAQGDIQGAAGAVIREQEYVKVEGSPYLFDQWLSGAVKTRDGAISENLEIRYDMYRDQVQFKKDGSALAVDPVTAGDFWFYQTPDSGPSIYFKNGFKFLDVKPTDYLQVVFQSKHVSLLRKIKSEYVEENVKTYGTNELTKRFDTIKIEYLLVDGSPLKMEKNRKNFFAGFGDNEDALKNFAKDSKLSVKNEKDCVRIIEHYLAFRKK